MSEELLDNSNDTPPQQEPDRRVLKRTEEVLSEDDPHVFDGLEESVKDRILTVVTKTWVKIKSHSGPLPSPETLKKYSNLIPNGAERIMQMAEKQQEHRIWMEKDVVPKQVKQSGRGQIFGFTLAILALTLGSVLTYLGHDTVGGILLSSTVVGLATIFVIGKRAQSKDD